MSGTSARKAAMAMTVAMAAALMVVPVANAATYDLVIDEITVEHSGTPKSAIAYNGQTPGPTLRFKEGEEVTIAVTNKLDEATSIHWHGLIVPPAQDGVPGISFPGIAPGETFTYRFPIVQSGTYWFHSHSGMQEQDGAYGSIVIRSEEHTSELQSLMRISSAVFCLKKKKNTTNTTTDITRSYSNTTN